MRDFSKARLGMNAGGVVTIDGAEAGTMVRYKDGPLYVDSVVPFINNAVGRWNAVLDALAEYDDPYKSITSTTATRMADILRAAVTGEDART